MQRNVQNVSDSVTHLSKQHAAAVSQIERFRGGDDLLLLFCKCRNNIAFRVSCVCLCEKSAALCTISYRVFVYLVRLFDFIISAIFIDTLPDSHNISYLFDKIDLVERKEHNKMPVHFEFQYGNREMLKLQLLRGMSRRYTYRFR